MAGSELSNILKTLLCVAVAGSLFITAVFYDIKWLFILAAFFDWLPLATKWMKISGTTNSRAREAGIMHGVVTVVAYIIGIAWLFIDHIGMIDLGYLFILLWFQAVILGSYTTAVKLA
ncbi:hypothetical protein [Staphylothermus hellenicus]|uniref:Uncharacterized protein n=1 Tax=Staphylothermus hellenicus (strain DSM 12710 / JCM 10830 / BK20S6-10-b1 / P8) TaxID=591019 RepID=D7DBX1_STAHD|nr:hypothetical protein [Staphylothermus hellenicus]ADI31668.1 hypothetical protein Shell_0538 [Staphylothermus hellenicus DSM 12710]